jgi:hypothetical protein
MTKYYKYLLIFLLLGLVVMLSFNRGYADMVEGSGTDWELIDSPWPTHGHDFQRTNRSPYIGLENGAHVHWRQGFYGVMSHSLTVGIDGLIYAKSVYTYGFTPDGELVRADLPGGSCFSTPTHLNNGHIYYATTYSWIGVHTSGSLLWEYGFPAGCFHFTPAITKTGIGYFLFSPYVYAFDLNTHQLLWTYLMAGWTSMALAHDDTLYVSGLYGSLVALNPDGSIKWERKDFPSTGYLYRTIVMAVGDDDTIYSSRFKDANLDGLPDNNLDTIRALDMNSNALWDFTLNPGEWSCGLALTTDSTLYITTSSITNTEGVTLYSVASDGTLNWSRSLPTYYACGGPVTDNVGNVYVCGRNGRCYGFNAAGETLWDVLIWPNEWLESYPLIFADGQMFIPLTNGVIALAEGNPDLSFIPFMHR